MAPRRGRHNTGGGRQPRAQLFDVRREELFKYDAKNALADTKLEVGEVNAFLQMVISRGSRTGVAEAKAFVRDKAGEAFIDERRAAYLLQLLDKYSVYR